MKSAIVDTVRYTQLIRAGGLTADQQGHLLDKLVGKLDAAGAYWGWPHGIDRGLVERVVRGV
jgi:hypothetical protein